MLAAEQPLAVVLYFSPAWFSGVGTADSPAIL